MIQIVPFPYKIIEGNGYFPLPEEKPLTLEDFDNIKKLWWLDFIKDESLVIDGNNSECYRLAIYERSATIIAPTAEGAFYGYITLMQLSNTYKNHIPCMVIEDKPLYPYRGFMLDVARYYFSVSDIKKIIDICAIHKLNSFHIHLTDDQGWRIEIKKYPLLATYGSQRSHTNFDFKKQGGFYTQSEIREIIRYAHKRFIDVIPEIDMPGHMQSAIACYPYLSCFNRKLEVATHWGVKHDILCAGKDSTYRFIYDVIDEIIDLFDSPFIHLGGDEAVKTRWKLCPNCQAKMKELGLKNEDELQSYFMNKIATYVESRGKHAIMWNEQSPTRICKPSIAWQFWTNTASQSHQVPDVISDVNQGRLFINSDSLSWYLDMPYANNNLETAYCNIPEIKGLKSDCLYGCEACLWSEYVPDLKTAIYKILPRLGALCENMWSPLPGRFYGGFKARLNSYYRYMTDLGYTPAPLKKVNPNSFMGFFEKLWFNRRQLHWHGLHNLIDNAKVASMAKKQYPLTMIEEPLKEEIEEPTNIEDEGVNEETDIKNENEN